MDQAVARLLAKTAFRAAKEMTELLPLLKAHLEADAYRERARAIADAVHGINRALLDPALAAHPDLDAEISASIEKYDRFI